MKRSQRFVLIFLMSISSLSCTHPKVKSADNLASFIQQKADSLLHSEKVPGIFIGVLDGAKRSYYSFGYADPGKKKPFDSATIFETGSITKTFTAFVLEKVLQEKGISDSSSIINYLPDSLKTNKALQDISFLSLLNHTSGLPRLPENMDLLSDFMSPYDHYTEDQLFSYLKNCTPVPDGKSSYSNLGMGLAGMLAQRITGKEFFELLDEYIFIPFQLGRADKIIDSTENKGQGYFGSEKAPYWKMSILGPAYVLKSSAAEMLTYLQYMSSPTDSNAARIINKLLQPTARVSPVMQVCRAWHLIEQKTAPDIYMHNGSTYGFSTFAGFIKGKTLAVIVVTNSFNKATVSDVLGVSIMKRLTPPLAQPASSYFDIR
jgi:CubicO group peptidase (beta-lactamase class C family)